MTRGYIVCDEKDCDKHTHAYSNTENSPVHSQERSAAMRQSIRVQRTALREAMAQPLSLAEDGQEKRLLLEYNSQYSLDDCARYLFDAILMCLPLLHK
ncbi:hypothetical protein EVAR_25262_1 [Eumeta japonica]|uniref:Uncharacterized protein n=1 Tax=Eumeta variegata TaxID=151549 RepID=A0A4C1VPE4_EUMVA|nr:hypothetical protein EVAR_25262_1 [Eumeta japonica]